MPLELETAKATLDCARADVDAENARGHALDAKLTQLAAFAAITLSISGALGGSVLADHDFDLTIARAIGVCLGLGVALLFSAVISCFHGLFPKSYQGIALGAATDRVRPSRLSLDPPAAIARLASTYYTSVLPAARSSNSGKVEATKCAYWLVGLGLLSVAGGLALTMVAAVWCA